MPFRPPTHKPPAGTLASDAPRPSPAQRGYGSAWRVASKQFLAVHRWCAICLARGDHVLATLVDHIKPHNGDRGLFWLRSNWQALCAPCHGVKTAGETNAKRAASRLRE